MNGDKSDCRNYWRISLIANAFKLRAMFILHRGYRPHRMNKQDFILDAVAWIKYRRLLSCWNCSIERQLKWLGHVLLL